MKKEPEFQKCCAEEIRHLWSTHGGPMGIIYYETACPSCKQYIGLTQTSEQEASEFLSNHNLVL